MVETQRYIILLPGEGQRSPTKSLCAPENLVLDGGTAVIAIDVDDPDLDRCQGVVEGYDSAAGRYTVRFEARAGLRGSGSEDRQDRVALSPRHCRAAVPYGVK